MAILETQFYYNRYNRDTNTFKKIRYISSRGTQSSEMNELQEIILENGRELFNTLFRNGSIVSGGNILRSGYELFIEYGVVYYDGLTIKVPQKILTIEPNEDGDIGILISENIIKPETDVSLLNPAVNTVLFKQKGAERTQIIGEWMKSADAVNLLPNQKFFPRFSVVDGNLNQQELTQTTELQNAYALIQKYDFDSNGNYVVNGLNVYYDSNLISENKYLLSIKEGRCHVNGFEYNFPAKSKVKIDYPLTNLEVIGEPALYQTSVTRYVLRNSPIASITQILAFKLVTNASVTHGGFTGAIDLLPNTPVSAVLSVTQGATTYVAGIDYNVVGDTIDWSLPGAEPSPGSTYSVTFTYVTTNVDYSINPDLVSINVPNTNGLQNNSNLFITYNYYLPRQDRLIVNLQGALEVLKGFSKPINPIAPVVSSGLSLAVIDLVYGQIPVITEDTFRVLKMSDLQLLSKRLAYVEYNITQLSLKEDINGTDPTTNKKNVFVDSMLNDNLRDAGQTQNAVIVNQTLIPNVIWTSNSLYKGNEILIGYTPVFALIQDSYTKSRAINEFTWQSAPPGYLTVSPATYRWVEQEVIKEVWEPVRSRKWADFPSPDREWLSGNTFVDTTTTTEFIEINAPIPNITINLTGGLWNFNEVLDVYYDSVKVTTITADGTGKINYNLQIPAGSMSGTIPVRVEGTVSGVISETTFTAIPLAKIITKRKQTWTIWNDPLAQTFTLTRPTFIISAQIWVIVNTPTFIDVFICKTLVGFPNRSQVVARKRLYPQEIFINQWQDFQFDSPILLNANEEYALVVECTDSVTEVAVAELGQYAVNTGKWLTGQALDGGVLLHSANGSTWSALQKEDMMFRLKACQFNPSRQISLGVINVSNVTDLMLLTGVDVPANTRINFKVVLLDDGNKEYDISPYSVIEIAPYSGDIQLMANMETLANNISPAIEGDVILATGQVELTSNYISRAFAITNTSTTFNIILDVNEPGASTTTVQYQDSNNVWQTLTRDNLKSRQIGNGWVEVTYTQSISNLTSTRIQIILNSPDSLNRPYARNIRFYSS